MNLSAKLLAFIRSPFFRRVNTIGCQYGKDLSIGFGLTPALVRDYMVRNIKNSLDSEMNVSFNKGAITNTPLILFPGYVICLAQLTHMFFELGNLPQDDFMIDHRR